MAEVLNKTNRSVELVAKNGSSCMIHPGKNKVEDKFCTNLPPYVTLVPTVKVVQQKTQVKTAASTETAEVTEADESAVTTKKKKK